MYHAPSRAFSALARASRRSAFRPWPFSAIAKAAQCWPFGAPALKISGGR
jgi:hypothetical protein